MANTTAELNDLLGPSSAGVVKFARDLQNMSDDDFTRFFTIADDDADLSSTANPFTGMGQNMDFSKITEMFSTPQSVANTLQQKVAGVLKGQEMKDAYAAATTAVEKHGSLSQLSMAIDFVHGAMKSRASKIELAKNPSQLFAQIPNIVNEQNNQFVAEVITVGLVTDYLAKDENVDGYSSDQARKLYDRYVKFYSEKSGKPVATSDK